MKGKELSSDFKKQTEELKNKDKKTFYEIFKEYKTVFYCSLFFAAGLLCGAFLYKKCATDVIDEIMHGSEDKLVSPVQSETNDFLNLFINNLGFYMLVFSLTVLLGICLIGFPVINAVPLVIGIQAGLKIAYYYLNYGFKGFGYSILMIAPFVCSFLTVIVYTISLSSELSKKIYNVTTGKADDEKIEYKTYMKKYLLYALLTVGVALLNSGITAALGGIVAI